MRFDKGQTIIELLLAMGFALIFFPALFTMFFVSREGKAQQLARTHATPYMVETQEALRSIRERGWDAFAAYANGTAYHPVAVSNRWELSEGTETIGTFERSIVFSPVYRNTEGAIVASGGTEDPSTRKATITVSWTIPLSASVSTDLFITRHGNIVEVDTTKADFDAGEHTQTRAITLDDGEVVLGSTGGFGDWCTPELTISAADLPRNGVANAISAIQGRIAVGTGENASGVSYANLLVSDPAYPGDPQASISGTFDGYKTNDVFTEETHAYIATDTNNKEIVIVNLESVDANGKHQEVGHFDAPGNGDGFGVVTKDSTGYMTNGSYLHTFNLTTKSGSRPLLDPDGVTLPGPGRQLTVIGTRAFIVTGATDAQLVIADVSNPSDISITSTIALPALGATSLYVNSSGSRAYVVTGSSASQRELFIINTEIDSPGYGTVIGSYDTNGMDPRGVVTVSGPRAIVVGINGQEYQVVDITNEAADPLPQCGGIEINTGINGIDTVFASSGRAYSYIITGDAASELRIIEGGPGAGIGDYHLSGTYTSRIFDAEAIASGSSEPLFNRISATVTIPSAVTDLSLQVAVADAPAGVCADAAYTYVGPDGTSTTSYTSSDGTTISGNIPFNDDGMGYENPARCFRYKASFSTTDNSLTPIIHDVTISYSP